MLEIPRRKLLGMTMAVFGFLRYYRILILNEKWSRDKVAGFGELKRANPSGFSPARPVPS
jgi:hypothetical protein